MNAIDPGAGYRLLKEGEEIREGDDVFCDNPREESWHKTILVGRKVGHQKPEFPYRRKIESGWIRLSERLPDKFPCQVWGPGLEKALVSTQCYSAPTHSKLTHWQPLELAAPPEPEKPVDEVTSLKAKIEKATSSLAHSRDHCLDVPNISSGVAVLIKGIDAALKALEEP